MRLPLAVLALTLALAAPASAVSGGTTLPIAQAPYVAWLGGRCTGTLISPTRVLTAAHCLDNHDAAGEHLLIGVDGNTGKGKAVAIEGYSVDPRFKLSFPFSHATPQSAIAVDDVGVIVLKKPVMGIAPIRVADGSDASLEAPGTPTTLIGYGITTPDEGAPRAPLQQGVLPRISAAQCLAAYPRAIDANMGCALDPRTTGPFTQACPGDSGGPVVVSTPGGPVQIGVTSWGPETMDGLCGQKPLPDVFMRTAAFTKFLATAELPILPFTHLTHRGSTARIAGTPRVGHTLTCEPVKLGGDPATLHYFWTKVTKKGIVDIPNAQHRTLAVTAKLRDSVPFNHAVFCNALARNKGGELLLQSGSADLRS
jgi:secreted trypsin-like serine protease